jgi:hypothetical protein
MKSEIIRNGSGLTQAQRKTEKLGFSSKNGNGVVYRILLNYQVSKGCRFLFFDSYSHP